ncbi:MAG: hypothetical protein ACXVCY_00390 [Pseudobdellovibrionaceae bacterium]
MSKVFFSVTLFILAANSTSYAQLRASKSSSLEDLKESRKKLEIRTENQILEKLEAARLEDEKNRRSRFETLNFSVVSDEQKKSN